MTIELFMIDMLGDEQAHKVLAHCLRSMPHGFFTRATLCSPQIIANSLQPLPPYLRWVESQFLPAPPRQRQLYNIWRQREMVRLVEADFFMVVQKDGYILNPSRWEDDFLAHDWIGAPWSTSIPGGNSGFHLRSRRFALWLANHPAPYPIGMDDDWYVCNHLATEARAAGFSFAPTDLAARFSLENPLPEYPHQLSDVFGFHGAHLSAMVQPL